MIPLHDLQPHFTPVGRFADGPFMARDGPARAEGLPKSNKKLCFCATDVAVLANVLWDLSQRDDCFFVKYSANPRDGMYLGRCFLTDDEAVAQLCRELKRHPRLLVSVQDDDWFNPYRGVSTG